MSRPSSSSVFAAFISTRIICACFVFSEVIIFTLSRSLFVIPHWIYAAVRSCSNLDAFTNLSPNSPIVQVLHRWPDSNPKTQNNYNGNLRERFDKSLFCNVCQNLKCFIEIRNLCRNSKFLSEFETFVKILNFCEYSKLLSKLDFFVKIGFFVKIRNFCQTSKHFCQNSIFCKIRIFCQHSKLLSKF